MMQVISYMFQKDTTSQKSHSIFFQQWNKENKCGHSTLKQNPPPTPPEHVSPVDMFPPTAGLKGLKDNVLSHKGSILCWTPRLVQSQPRVSPVTFSRK